MRFGGLVNGLKRQFYRQQVIGIAVVIVVAGIGTYLLVASHAASPFASSEAENGNLSGGATAIADSNASGGSAIKFGTGSTTTGAGNCPGLPAGAAAFCDTFDSPTTNSSGAREGELNGTVWGVSRQLGFNNEGQNQLDAGVSSLVMQGSCPTQTVTIETDIKICNGQLNEVVNDNPDINASNYAQQNLQTFNSNIDDDGTVTALAMYPKQPFDFAGRTGKIVFDVNDDSGGTHWAWPEFWMSNLPVPVPFTHFSSWQSLPQYGFGIRFADSCPANSGGCGARAACPNEPQSVPVVNIDSAITINNYQENDNSIYGGGGGDTSPDNPANLQITDDNCVVQPTQAGQLNHFEIDVSENQIDIYGTDPFSGALNLTATPLKHLATIANANLGFTRGFIWLEDAHYNADKEIGTDDAFQAMHTFTWDNVGFDGPVLPRDLGFDAADSLTTNSDPTTTNLGWFSSSSSPATVSVPNVSGMLQAAAALLEFNFIAPDTTSQISLDYSINGHTTHTVPWPFLNGISNYTAGDSVNGSPRTIAIPITANLSEVVNGTNQVKIWSPDANGNIIVSNVDLIMAGAGGPGGIASP